MSDLEKGDRVIATESISTGIFSSVEKGTKGVVADCETSFLSSTTYEVHWEDGEKTQGVDGDALAKLVDDDSGDGCALLILAGALALVGGWVARS